MITYIESPKVSCYTLWFHPCLNFAPKYIIVNFRKIEKNIDIQKIVLESANMLGPKMKELERRKKDTRYIKDSVDIYRERERHKDSEISRKIET